LHPGDRIGRSAPSYRQAGGLGAAGIMSFGLQSLINSYARISMTRRLHIVSSAALFIACMGLLPQPAPGQSHGGGGGRPGLIVNRNDDGSGAGPQVMRFSMPDIFSARQPDFLKRDLPMFKDKLVLSEPQTAAMDHQLDKYLEDFANLKKQMLQNDSSGPMFLG